jgi:hypothetical protein
VIYRGHVAMLASEMQEVIMMWACTSDGTTRNIYRVLVGKSLGKRPLGDRDVDWNIT